MNNSIKSSNKNWFWVFEKHNLKLKTRRVRVIDWKHHENNIYVKITHWFKVIERIIQDPVILQENVYNMNEMRVMLSILDSVKVLVDKNNLQDYRGVSVKWTMISAIKCVSTDDRSQLSLIIWLASTYWNN